VRRLAARGSWEEDNVARETKSSSIDGREIQMKRMTAMLVLMLGATVASATPATSESVEALLAITRMEAAVNGLYADVEKALDQQMTLVLSQARPSDAQREALEAMQRDIRAALRNELSWASLKPAYVQLYQESLTQEEVDGLLEFYRTPSGQALIHKMPVIMRTSIALSQDKVRPLVARLVSNVQRALK
jgi:hypothetical protein